MKIKEKQKIENDLKEIAQTEKAIKGGVSE